MRSFTRCQAIILRGNDILVLRQYSKRTGEEYWLLPGGRMEGNETPEEAVKREIKEETNLDVVIDGILFDEPGRESSYYSRFITFLCIPVPESFENIRRETGEFTQVLDLVWSPILDENQWNEYLLKDQIYPSMKRIKEKLLSLELC